MSKLVECKSCGTAISRDAKVCPKCGTPAKKRRVGLIAALSVGGLVLIGAAGAGKHQRAETPAARTTEAGAATVTGAPEPQRKAPAVLAVSAEQLFRDYKANEVSADDKYRGT